MLRNFIKIELVGLGWGDSGHGSLADYQKFANHIADFFRIGDFYDQDPGHLRNVSISVGETLDHIHVIYSDQQLLVTIKD